MSNERFDVVFSGQILEGADPSEVKARLGTLFRVDGKRLEKLFDGEHIVIKRDVDKATTRKYRAALRKAGAACTIRPTARAAGGDTSPPAAPPPAAEAPAGDGSDAGTDTRTADTPSSGWSIGSADPDLGAAWARRRRLRRWGVSAGAGVGAVSAVLVVLREEPGSPAGSVASVSTLPCFPGAMGALAGFALVELGRSLIPDQRMLAREIADAWRVAELLAAPSAEAGFSGMRVMHRYLGPALGLTVVALVGTVFFQTRHQMDMLARVDYAFRESAALQTDVARFLLERGRLPAGRDELGAGARKDYPDGGYYYLADQGHVVIRFTELPELAVGSIHMTPRLVDGGRGVVWECSSVDGFPSRYLPKHYCQQ